MEIILLCFAVFIFIQYYNIRKMTQMMQSRISLLERALARLSQKVHDKELGLPAPSAPVSEIQKENTAQPAASQPAATQKSVPQKTPQTNTATPQKAHDIKEKLSFFEQNIGSKLAVWFGAVALIFAGFYLVKYSIEGGYLTPAIRIILGFVFALILEAAGYKIKAESTASNAPKIAQGLVGAGIAVGYASFFMAVNFYHILSPVLGFSGMFFLTLYAVAASVKFGAPVALLGLAGGFITPVFIVSISGIIGLFAYLSLLCAGFFYLAVNQKWPFLIIFILFLSFIAIFITLAGNNSLGISEVSCIFMLLCVLMGGVVSLLKLTGEIQYFGSKKPAGWVITHLNHIGFAGIFALSCLTLLKSPFGLTESMMFSVFVLAGFILPYLKFETYKFLPPACFAFSALIAASSVGSLTEVLVIYGVYGGINLIGSHILFKKTPQVNYWGLYYLASLLVFYLLAYLKFRTYPEISDIRLLWGILAAAGALLALQMLSYALKHCKNNDLKEKLAGYFAMGTTAFLSIALTIELNTQFLASAFAGQLFATILLGRRIKIYREQTICCVLLGISLYLQLPFLSSFALFAAGSVIKMPVRLPQIDYPMLFILAAAVYLSLLFYKARQGVLLSFLRYASLMLGGILLYMTMRSAMNMSAGFIQRGIITFVFMCAASGLLLFGKKYSLTLYRQAGELFMFLCMARVVWFDMIIFNPYFFYAKTGSLPLINGGLLNYLLPVLLTSVLVKKNAFSEKRNKTAVGFIALAGFFFLCFETAQFYRGSVLTYSSISNAELYTYSALWLLTGIILLFCGIYLKNQKIRIGALSLLIIATGKVFLIDASSLEGLYKVFSFLGLGVCLMGLSYIYSSFVAEKKS